MAAAFDLPLCLPEKGSRRLLRSLHAQLRAAIVEGRLKPGSRLPPTRTLAARLGIARNTAIATYDLLVSEGHAVSRRGAGTYVAHSTFRSRDRRCTMPKQQHNRIAVLLNDTFADWETGFLSASARTFFGAEVLHFSPHGGQVLSEGGLSVTPAGAFDEVDPALLNGVVVCGSGNWTTPVAPDITELLRQAEQAQVAVGAICAGTVPVARAGLLDDRSHTSNGAPWLKEHAPAYRGAARYKDVNDAVTDRAVVTAPASAPAAFAIAMLKLMYPEHPKLSQTVQMLSRAR